MPPEFIGIIHYNFVLNMDNLDQYKRLKDHHPSRMIMPWNIVVFCPVVLIGNYRKKARGNQFHRSNGNREECETNWRRTCIHPRGKNQVDLWQKSVTLIDDSFVISCHQNLVLDTIIAQSEHNSDRLKSNFRIICKQSSISQVNRSNFNPKRIQKRSESSPPCCLFPSFWTHDKGFSLKFRFPSPDVIESK